MLRRFALSLLALYSLLCVSEAANRKKKEEKKEGADYYAILGVDRKADAAAVKKAYKELALKFHPDKCDLGEDVCQAKFIEVSTANEVLTDPEKRKTYDEHGEEGLKEGHQSGDQAKAMFRQFFGREPDGNVKIINQGGRMTFHEEGEPGPQENIFDDTNITELTNDIWKAYLIDRDRPWIVNFYKPNDDDSVDAKPEYLQFGNTFHEFLNVASVNCRKERGLCSSASINDFPALRWFAADAKADPEVYEGPVTAKALGKWASDMMPDHTTILEDKQQLRQWLDNAKGPTVLLFTDKASPPPMWKALSLEFNNRAALGVVRRCDKHGVFKTLLQQMYDVRIPQIIRVDAIDDLGKIAEKFDSQLKVAVLQLWLTKIVAMGRKAGPVAAFKEWNRERLEAGDCAPQDGQFCFLWLKAGADPAVEEAMKSLAKKYRTDPIKMMWANVELNPDLLDAFGLQEAESSTGDFFVAYRPKRSKFKVHEGELSIEALDSFVDGTLNGGPLTGKLLVPHIEL